METIKFSLKEVSWRNSIVAVMGTITGLPQFPLLLLGTNNTAILYDQISNKGTLTLDTHHKTISLIHCVTSHCM